VESLTDLTLFRHSIGWQFEKGETGNYWMIKNAGISGGLAPRENPEQMPTIFVAVESIAEYINKAQAAWSKSNQK
jgi:predicted enzyme related to lactoylglutathione lyase